MPEHDGEKTQEPTQHRRMEARKQGQVAKSQDLGSAILLLLGLLVLWMAGPHLIDYLGAYSAAQFGGPAWLTTDVDTVMVHWSSVMLGMAKYVLPILGLLLLAAIAENVLQIGFLFLPDKLAPDLSRISPMKGFGRLFSLASTMRLLFGLFKVLVIGAVAGASLYARREEILGLTALGLGESTVYLLEILLWTSVKIAIALLLLALLDFGFQRWKHERDLKMTPQEMREEMRNLEGNPEIRARRRQVQRQLAQSRTAKAVPKADVVVTNPTELAVAIRYDPQTMAAPIVVAKGAGLMAQRIRKIALENGIPIVERKPLAQALYREVDIDQPIPADKYAAVAEVLAYVYQLKGKKIPGATGRAA
ncbi:MAG: flagellar biosynthesis protein FlhB [Pirellulales bacterium]|nr:flagellar biosynthesis protein FlhB [Pirellulales bacterium]